MKALPGSELMTIHLCQPLRIAVKEGCRSLHPELGDNETDDRIMEIVASFRVVGVASSPDRSPHTGGRCFKRPHKPYNVVWCVLFPAAVV